MHGLGDDRLQRQKPFDRPVPGAEGNDRRRKQRRPGRRPEGGGGIWIVGLIGVEFIGLYR